VILSRPPAGQAQPAPSYTLGQALRARRTGETRLWVVATVILNTMGWHQDGPGLRIQVRHDHILRTLAQEKTLGWAQPGPHLPPGHAHARASTDSALQPQPNDPHETREKLELARDLTAFRRNNPGRGLHRQKNNAAETNLYNKARTQRGGHGLVPDVLDILGLHIPEPPAAPDDAARFQAAGILGLQPRQAQAGPSAAPVPALPQAGEAWPEDGGPEGTWPEEGGRGGDQEDDLAGGQQMPDW
jgi:hypothetical protein